MIKILKKIKNNITTNLKPKITKKLDKYKAEFQKIKS